MGDTSNIIGRLCALARLVREITAAGELREIYQSTLTALAEVVGVERSGILLLDEAGVAHFVAWRGVSDDYRAAAAGHFPWAVDERHPRPILVEDVAAEPGLAALAPMLAQDGIRALAFIPLVYRERLIGKFMLYFGQPHVFTREETELAATLSALVAFAIERTRLYAELADADRRKDVFLATLAHELRNPLAPITAALELMNERPDLETFTRVRDTVTRSVQQIVKLVDELLDVSRITRGVVSIDKQPVDLATLVHHAIEPVQALVAAQRQQLTLSLEPLSLTADPIRIEQVLTNLIDNAAKYTPAGGHIWVTTRASDGGVEIRVRDDGIGVEPEMIPRLFDLFVQADQSLARTRGGLGVGLTIVRELVHLHGGTVHAASAGRGQGTEVTVWLPGRIERARPRAAPAHAPHAPSRKVLVVDDNADAKDMLATLLATWGHDVSTASDGASALAAVERQHPDVVLLDLGLPDIDGYEVARRLRTRSDGGLRIVAVSGYNQPADIARAREAGCDEHLAKPVDLRGLERALAA